jgi:phosphoribosylformylglycinamidine synthase
VNLRPEPGAFGQDRDGTGRQEVLQIPIKHGEGQFIASDQELDRIEESGLVLLRYCSPQGMVDEAFNPNGAARGIAGIRNEAGNVIGMMPHPEHAVDPDLGPTGGHVVFEWLLARAGSPATVNA